MSSEKDLGTSSINSRAIMVDHSSEEFETQKDEVIKWTLAWIRRHRERLMAMGNIGALQSEGLESCGGIWE